MPPLGLDDVDRFPSRHRHVLDRLGPYVVAVEGDAGPVDSSGHSRAGAIAVGVAPMLRRPPG
ncbi:hypothetical protein DT019_37190 [Streptomyces sp. SDr-06]|nr:hypothetical protein DT019_37190 [Streptomyces sp. SDr-06]